MVISKGNIPLSFDILELSEVVEVVFFLFFLIISEQIGSKVWEILRMKSLVYLIWFLFELNFSSFFFFFKYLETDMYIYIYLKFEIFHINNIPYRHAFEIFEISRFTREDWNLNNSILYSAISLQIFSTKYSDIII